VRSARVLFRARPAQVRERECARRGDQRFAGSCERVTECVHGVELRGDRGGEVSGTHLLMFEREMDDTVAGCGRLFESVEIVQVSSAHRRAERGHGRCGGVRSREADDIMTGGDQFRNDCRADVAGRAGDENTQGGSWVP
jgi:hypothetical protein